MAEKKGSRLMRGEGDVTSQTNSSTVGNARTLGLNKGLQGEH